MLGYVRSFNTCVDFNSPTTCPLTMSKNVGDVVLPGDVVKQIKSVKNVTVLGPGLRRLEDDRNGVYATRTGRLCFKAPNTYWIEGKQRRYIPKKGDLVVGIVSKKAGDTLRIDIGAPESAALSMFSFEGATKKQKPDLQVGDCICARVLTAHREMEPELVCVDSYFKAGKLGVLSNDGMIINVNPDLAHRLLNVENPFLATLGKKFPYEVAIGMNGKIWINAKCTKDLLTCIKAIEAVEFHTDKTVTELCRQFK